MWPHDLPPLTDRFLDHGPLHRPPPICPRTLLFQSPPRTITPGDPEYLPSRFDWTTPRTPHPDSSLDSSALLLTREGSGVLVPGIRSCGGGAGDVGETSPTVLSPR